VGLTERVVAPLQGEGGGLVGIAFVAWQGLYGKDNFGRAALKAHFFPCDFHPEHAAVLAPVSPALAVGWAFALGAEGGGRYSPASERPRPDGCPGWSCQETPRECNRSAARPRAVCK